MDLELDCIPRRVGKKFSAGWLDLSRPELLEMLQIVCRSHTRRVEVLQIVCRRDTRRFEVLQILCRRHTRRWASGKKILSRLA